MNNNVKDAFCFLMSALGVALVILAICGGIALTMANGSSQTCARHGGQWSASDTPSGAGIERTRECIK